MYAQEDENAASTQTLRITEIFHSIQGESTWAGRPCTFVRLTGCPLRCTWCDTEYAFSGGERMALDTILERVASFNCELVELTGGEPLAQRGAVDLARQIVEAGYTLLVETSGAFDVSGLPEQAHVVMDLKCPASGEVQKNLWSNLEHLDERDEVKFVVTDRADYEWMKATIEDRKLDQRVRSGTLRALLVSPVWDSAQTPHGPQAGTEGHPFLAQLSAWILEDALPVRLQLQLHKLIWGPNVAGV